MSHQTYRKIKFDYNSFVRAGYNQFLLSKPGDIMVGGSLKQRAKLYNEASTELAYLSNTSIKNLIEPMFKKEEKFKRWGVTGTITLQGNAYFVKMIPVSDKFMKNQSDSSNVYELPSYYNYGFGSAGSNPWRELMLHIKTTNYVLEDKCENFPILYHHRIISFDHTNGSFETGLKEKLSERYADNQNIMNYLKDRSEAKNMIVLFLEHIPNVLGSVIQQDYNFIEKFYSQAKKIIGFLHENNISHNDAHGYNFS